MRWVFSTTTRGLHGSVEERPRTRLQVVSATSLPWSAYRPVRERSKPKRKVETLGQG